MGRIEPLDKSALEKPITRVSDSSVSYIQKTTIASEFHLSPAKTEETSPLATTTGAVDESRTVNATMSLLDARASENNVWRTWSVEGTDDEDSGIVDSWELEPTGGEPEDAPFSQSDGPEELRVQDDGAVDKEVEEEDDYAGLCFGNCDMEDDDEDDEQYEEEGECDSEDDVDGLFEDDGDDKFIMFTPAIAAEEQCREHGGQLKSCLVQRAEGETTLRASASPNRCVTFSPDPPQVYECEEELSDANGDQFQTAACNTDRLHFQRKVKRFSDALTPALLLKIQQGPLHPKYSTQAN